MDPGPHLHRTQPKVSSCRLGERMGVLGQSAWGVRAKAVYGVKKGCLSFQAQQSRLAGATLAALSLIPVFHQGVLKLRAGKRMKSKLEAGRLREKFI